MSLRWSDLSYRNIDWMQDRGRSEEEAKGTEEMEQGSDLKRQSVPRLSQAYHAGAMFSCKAKSLARIPSIETEDANEESREQKPRLLGP